MGMFVFFPGLALQRMQNSDKEEFLRHDTDIEWGADSRGVYITQIVQYEWTVCSRAFFVVARPALMLARLTRSFFVLRSHCSPRQQIIIPPIIAKNLASDLCFCHKNLFLLVIAGCYFVIYHVLFCFLFFFLPLKWLLVVVGCCHEARSKYPH